MIARLATFLIAMTLIAPAASAQTSAARPDPAAFDLAHLLMQRDETLYDDADLVRFRARIEAALLASEGSCDPRNSECLAAAREVADQYAPALRENHRGRSEGLVAATLAATLRLEEMIRIAAWLRSDEGGHFLAAWASLRDPELARQRRRALQGDLARTATGIFNTARASFGQRIRNIPQAAPR
jgi:hypothetical protein